MVEVARSAMVDPEMLDPEMVDPGTGPLAGVSDAAELTCASDNPAKARRANTAVEKDLIPC
jgi:hypothetical protein